MDIASDNRLFKVRCFNMDTGEVEVFSFTLWEISAKANLLNMHMVDIGFILLNENRRLLGLDPLSIDDIIADDLDHLCKR
jgi:hypothetical protein